MLPAQQFIPLAEDNGLIRTIGAWVIGQACCWAARWGDSRTDDPLTVSVNLSARQLAQPDLVDSVARSVAEAGLDPRRLCFEVTETVLMDDVAANMMTLSALKRLGVKLLVDDFGTGYSSLSYLHSFPVDGLKIDRSFVAGLGVNDADTAIVTAVMSLAHALGISATAEGVETAAQLDELRRIDCDLAQGYHIG